MDDVKNYNKYRSFINKSFTKEKYDEIISSYKNKLNSNEEKKVKNIETMPNIEYEQKIASNDDGEYLYTKIITNKTQIH